MAMEAELLLKRTFFEVGLPLWVERVGGLPDFDVAPNFGFARIHEALPNRLAIRCPLSRLARKRPSALAQSREALLLHPVPRFLGMSAFGPVPEPPPYLMVHPVERFLGRAVPMVVGPATNDRVQQTYLRRLAHGAAETQGVGFGRS